MKRIWILLIVAAALVAMWVVSMYIGFAAKQHDIERLSTASTTEQRADYERRVAEYNESFEHFPGNIFGRAFGFQPYE
jgi:hypothetical protein